jgi:hypothetical protein
MVGGEVTVAAGAPGACRLFISYKRDCQPDESVAAFLAASLARQGHRVFIDDKTALGDSWSDLIETEITSADFVVVLLTKASVAPGYVVAETLLARECERRTGRPRILPVRVAYSSILPLYLSGVIGHLHYFEWSALADNDVLLAELLRAIGRHPQGVTRPTALLRGDHFIVTESMWQSSESLESLAGTIIVPLRDGEESSLPVTRAKGPGYFGLRVLNTGALEVAIWKGANYRAVESQPGQFVEMLQGDFNRWCFARHKPHESILLKRPDGRKDPIVVTFDQDVVRAVWTITHQRGSRFESFLIVMKDPAPH